MTLQVHPAPGHVALRVTAKLGDRLVYKDDLLHLDGPLAAGVFLSMPFEERDAMPSVDVVEFPADLPLPLSRWSTPAPAGTNPRLTLPASELGGQGDEPRLWGWIASAADDRAWRRRGVHEVRKKPALGEMVRHTKDNSANVSSGHLKAYDLKLPTVFAHEVTWFAFGDAAAVRAALDQVPWIGGKRNSGCGTVLSWHVEPIAGDAMSVIVGDGRALRRLPAGAAKGSPGRGTIRPPYYHPTRAVVSVGP